MTRKHGETEDGAPRPVAANGTVPVLSPGETEAAFPPGADAFAGSRRAAEVTQPSFRGGAERSIPAGRD
jgi:hypothetical protein